MNNQIKTKAFSAPSKEEAVRMALKTPEGKAKAIEEIMKRVESLEHHMKELRESIKHAFEGIVNEDKEWPEE